MHEIDKILTRSLSFDDHQKIADFIGSFKELYKVPLFKVGLDVILTKAELGLVKFQLQEKNITETYHGCCITKQETLFNKIFSSFSKNYKHVINIRTLTVDVIMHEIAHALEKESKINLQDEFASIFATDLKNTKHSHINIQLAIKQIIFKELNLYPNSQHNSELLARFYELLAMSKEVGHYHNNYHFKLNEILSLFYNTVEWIDKVFNDNLKSQILDHIPPLSKNIKFDQNLRNFTRKHKSLHASKVYSNKISGNKSLPEQPSQWGKVIKSIFSD